ncbi:hypothetical protein JCM10213_003961 [Rhodosporidiobolus nylandii]
MDSSSDLEILTVKSVAPTPKPASPPKPRKSGRARRAPRGVDETARPAAPLARRTARDSGMDTDDDVTGALSEVDVELSAFKAGGGGAAAFPLPPLPEAPVASTSKAPAVISVISSSASSTLAASSSDPTLSATRLSPAPSLTRASSASAPISTLSTTGGTKRPRSGTPGEAAPPRKLPTSAASKPPLPKTSYSSDEADDFFVKKPVPAKGRVPNAAKRVPGAGAGAGRMPGAGRKPGARSSATPAASPNKGKGKAKFVFSSDSEIDGPAKRSSPIASSASGSSDAALDSDSDAPRSPAKDKRKEKGVQHVNLPDWARQSSSSFARAGRSGADARLAAGGAGKNRARKRLDTPDPDEKEKSDEDRGLLDRWKEDSDTDDSIEIELGGITPKNKKKTAAAAVARSRSASGSAQPTPKAKSPARPRPTASPFRSSPRRAPSASTSARLPAQKQPGSALTLSSDSSGSDHDISSASRARTTFADEGDSDDLASLLARAKRLKEASTGGATFGGARARASATPVPAAAGAGSVLGSSSPSKSGGGFLSVTLRMVFDPTRVVPEIAKRAYEKEEQFDLEVDDTFSTLFYQLSVRRSIPSSSLVLTYLPPTSHGKAKPKQIYDFGTPSSLGFSAGQSVELRGYTRDVWDKVQTLEREKELAAEAAAASGAVADEDDEELERAAAAAAAQRARSPSAAASAAGTPAPAGGDDDEGVDAFPLTVRGGKDKSLSLAVPLRTTMAQLVKAYAKKQGGDAGKMWLEFDGDRLEPGRSVEDVKEEYDLEGEETFEVRGGQ